MILAFTRQSERICRSKAKTTIYGMDIVVAAGPKVTPSTNICADYDFSSQEHGTILDIPLVAAKHRSNTYGHIDMTEETANPVELATELTIAWLSRVR